MRAFLLAIITVIITAGCSTDPQTEPENQFEPFRVGAWMVTSPSTASYAGVTKSKMSIMTTGNIQEPADTIDIEQPGQQSAQLISIPGSDTQVYLNFSDSVGLQPQNWPDHISSEFVGRNKDSDGSELETRIMGGVRESTINSESVEIKLSIDYRCHAFPSDISQVRITLYRDQEDPSSSYRVYVIHADGFVPAIESITTCS